MSKQLRPYGGYWTQVKLQRVRQYLTAFLEEMEGKPYRTVYVDAFAGSGLVTMPQPKRWCHTRFTMTRAVSGFAGSITRRASSSRPLPVVIGG